MCKRNPTYRICVCFCLIVLAAGHAFADEPTAVRALMVTGGCCHDYENQKTIISEGLSQRVGPIDWTIRQYGDQRTIEADIYRANDWIDGFDVVVHNECFGGVTDPEFVSSIVAAHRRAGTPAIMIHCSIHSYRNSPAAEDWRGLTGAKSVRHEKKKRPLTVTTTAAGERHPITAAIKGSWTTPNGELYLIESLSEEAVVLAEAASLETGRDEPVIWTNRLGEVRIFSTTLGHHNETMRTETWQSIVAAGWQWALDPSATPDSGDETVGGAKPKGE